MNFAEPRFLLLLPLLLPAAVALYRRFRPGAPADGSPPPVWPVVSRLFPLLLLILALAGPTVTPPTPGVHTVYLIDGSDSIEEAQLSAALSQVTRDTRELREPDTAAVYLFGGDILRLAEGESRPTAIAEALRDAPERREAVDGAATDLRNALRRGGMSLPENGRRRVVLLTDGVETDGDGAAEASLLRERGITVSTFLLPPRGSTDPRVVAVSAPRRVAPEEIFEIAVTVEGATTGGELELYRGREILGRGELEASAGRRSYRYRVEAGAAGFATYTARLVPEQGSDLPVNNSGGTIVEVRGPRPVLYLSSGGEGDRRPFQEALEAQGVPVVPRSPEQIGGEILELTSFEAVVIDSLRASRFSLSGMRAIEAYVRETGGGLVTLGGPRSYGAGGYGQTPLEEALPVSVDVTSKVQVPTLAMLFLVDKSGSMGSSGGGASKLDIVKEALLSSVEVMQPNQLVGLLSFDADVEWSVPITRASEREEILRNVARLQGGGGTILASAMAEAASGLAAVEAATKHLIILSDGLTREADFPALTRELRELGATVSTVSIGSDADRGLMESIAMEGGGRYYHTDDTGGIPRIFTRETSIVARNVILEETFFPVQQSSGEILAGIERVPALRGFVLTYPKGSTRQLLNAPEGHPLLATWQYGLGRSAAFTSSIDGYWGGSWVSWDLLPRFAGQLVDWVRPATANETVYLGHRWTDEDRLELTAEVAAETEGGRDNPAIRGIVNIPDGESRTVLFRQEGPGLYRTGLPAETPGSYLVTLYEEDNRFPPTLLGVYRSYAAEYELLPPDPAALRRVARAGGGTAAAVGDTMDDAVGEGVNAETSVDSAVAGTPLSLTPHLLVAAMLLFVLRILLEALVSRRPRRRQPV